MTPSARPAREESPTFYWSYIDDAAGDDVLHALQLSADRLWAVAHKIPQGFADHRYAEGKWSIKEVLQHVIDSERIFAYRALRFAREDATPLAGFEENDYAPASRATRRGLHQLLREHDLVRAATIELFRSFDDAMMLRQGVANGKPVSVRALGWIIAGHAVHHAKVIEERYLPGTGS